MFLIVFKSDDFAGQSSTSMLFTSKKFFRNIWCVTCCVIVFQSAIISQWNASIWNETVLKYNNLITGILVTLNYNHINSPLVANRPPNHHRPSASYPLRKYLCFLPQILPEILQTSGPSRLNFFSSLNMINFQSVVCHFSFSFVQSARLFLCSSVINGKA